MNDCAIHDIFIFFYTFRVRFQLLYLQSMNIIMYIDPCVFSEHPAEIPDNNDCYNITATVRTTPVHHVVC